MPSLIRSCRRAAFALVTATCAGLLAFGAASVAHAQNAIDPNATPDAFVEAVGNRALEAVKNDAAIKSGDANAVAAVVNSHILPYVNMEKTTRLAAGRHWRQATPDQQKQLVDAFKGTLIRTYSSAFRQVSPQSRLTLLPYRGEAGATDTVVRSTLTRDGGGPVGIDYRLEKTDQGWKIYDLNVEGIWLIQNYRNQFAQEISTNGVDGLIAALNAKK